jgi:hypothetical protein
MLGDAPWLFPTKEGGLNGVEAFGDATSELCAILLTCCTLLNPGELKFPRVFPVLAGVGPFVAEGAAGEAGRVDPVLTRYSQPARAPLGVCEVDASG